MTRSLDGDALRELLRELARRMQAEGLSADLYVVGGGAMLLKGIDRSNTDDLDARVAGSDRIREIARGIGVERGLREDWLSGASDPYVPSPAESDYEVQIGSVTIRTASDEVLLAMKLVADREKDAKDIGHLIRRLRTRSAEDLVQHAKGVYGEEFLEFGLNAFACRRVSRGVAYPERLERAMTSVPQAAPGPT